MKLCNIYNFAPHYRASIFVEMDRAFDCDWYFGKSNADIKKMDYALLTGRITELNTRLLGPFSWYVGMLRLLRCKEYDTYLVFGQTKDLSTWIFCLIGRVFYPKKRIYLWTHGWYGKETSVQAFIKRIFFRLPNGGSFTYGKRARELMIKEGVSPDKLYVIYNSLNYDEQLLLRQQLKSTPLFLHHFRNNNRNIVFIGRLTKVKRFDLLIEAIKILKEHGEKYNVTFVGDGVERENMERMVEEKGIADQVWFYGACYDEKTNAELIYNADLCVSPGNIGLTAMHVLMFGCPVITNDDFAHQMPEYEAIHNGVTGSFFKAYESKSLADCISQWFTFHGDDREVVRELCYAEIDTYWNPHNQIKILKNVIEKK